MILLGALQIESFKSLQHLNLRFPRQGSVLVQGLNEAGKSTLFESIYFALYGLPLDSRLEECLRYGTDACLVRLTLNVDATRLEIERTLRRKGPSQATLVVLRPGLEPETVQGVRSVNTRIVEELGKLDGDSLLNSCFVEQKKLDKLEGMTGAERRESLLRLLNLEKLTQLEDTFRVIRADDQALSLSQQRRELAEVQQALPQLEEERTEVDRLLQALRVRRDLATMEVLTQTIAALKADVESLKGQKQGVEERLETLERLRQAFQYAQRIIGCFEALAPEKRRWAQLETEVAELDRKEREDLPVLESRYAELLSLVQELEALEAQQRRLGEIGSRLGVLADLEGARQRLRGERDRLQRSLREQQEEEDKATASLSQLEQEEQVLLLLEGERKALEGLVQNLEALLHLEKDLARAQEEAKTTGDRLAAATELGKRMAALEQEVQAEEGAVQAARKGSESLRQLSVRFQVADTLREWIRLRRSVDAFEKGEAFYQEKVARAEELRQEQGRARKELSAANRQMVRRGVFAGVGAIFAVASLVTGIPFLAVPLVLIAIGLGFLVLKAARVAGRLKAETAELQALADRQQQLVRLLRMEKEVAERLGGGAEDLARCERTLGSLGYPVPGSAEAGVAALAGVEKELQGSDRSAVASEQQQAEQALGEIEVLRRGKLVTIEGWRTQLIEADVDRLKRDRESWEAESRRLAREIVSRRDSLRGPLVERGLPEEVASVRSALERVRDRLATVRTRLEGKGDARRRLERAEAQIADLSAQLQKIAAELGQHEDEELASRATVLQSEKAELEATIERRRTVLAPGLSRHNLFEDLAAASAAVSRTETELAGLQRELARRSSLLAEREEREKAIAGQEMEIEAESLALADIPLGDLNVPLGEGEAAYRSFKDEAWCRWQALDEPGLRSDLARLNGDLGGTEARLQTACKQQADLESGLRSSLQDLGADPQVELTLVAVEADCPLVAQAAYEDQGELEVRSDGLQGRIGALQHQRIGLERRLGLVGVALDLEECRAEERRAERNLEVKRRALQIVAGARQRMVTKVLPNTERNMRFLLPFLTVGRYHDARITEDYQVEVWDEAAGRYMAKNIFSGGTRDQFSLALRLAFALATLPQELGTSPGFIFLDEPLSSFDGPRSQALVDLLTRGHIARSFMQIFVISHSSSFDPDVFPYHLRLEGGQVAESNLPAMEPALARA